MRGHKLGGLWTVISLRAQVHKALDAKPNGLLFHESFAFSLLPLHIGLRQYFGGTLSPLIDGLARFPTGNGGKVLLRTRVEPGSGMRRIWYGGRAEGIHNPMREPFGFLQFAPAVSPERKMSLARGRLDLDKQGVAASC